MSEELATQPAEVVNGAPPAEEEPVREHKCPQCDFRAKSSPGLSAHVRLIHKGGSSQLHKAKRRIKQAKLTKRAYRRKPKEPEIEQEINLNFCPCCGYNLRFLQAAMSVQPAIEASHAATTAKG